MKAFIKSEDFILTVFIYFLTTKIYIGDLRSLLEVYFIGDLIISENIRRKANWLPPQYSRDQDPDGYRS